MLWQSFWLLVSNCKDVCQQANIVSRKMLAHSGLETAAFKHRPSVLLPYLCYVSRYDVLDLKLYCRYEYTKPCIINRIWCLKQLWLKVNGHAWFHLQRLRWPVRNGEGAKNQNENICLQRGSNPHHACSRQESQRLRPLGHEGLMVSSV